MLLLENKMSIPNLVVISKHIKKQPAKMISNTQILFLISYTYLYNVESYTYIITYVNKIKLNSLHTYQLTI